MSKIDRRNWLAGAGALLLAPGLAAAAEPDTPYDYLFLDLETAPAGMTPARAYAEAVKAQLPAIAAAGGVVLGLFTPQIGWVARQAALLVRWTPGGKGREAAVGGLMRGKTVRLGQRGRLAPTSRPEAVDRPRPGGIYVHRWFVVEAKNVPEFLSLSVEGWRDFETRFDAHIFGLFTAERSPTDRRDGVTRLLLITRYKDHGVWETSRDPTTAAMAAFGRRQAITRDTWNASTLLAPI
ncbi:hypothetical protein [Phenylobacterium sp.]|uniref:hypothetical protein n=1 Tax=Phenylobacterium sp. TaxID=1871053 RepID=UPI0025EBE97D|nr:hypothetical protein [Phenylobacterium sp.]